MRLDKESTKERPAPPFHPGARAAERPIWMAPVRVGERLLEPAPITDPALAAPAAPVRLPVHIRERVAELRALHRPNRRFRGPGRLGWLFKVPGCALCGQRYPCSQSRWCDDVEAGLVRWRGTRTATS